MTEAEARLRALLREAAEDTATEHLRAKHRAEYDAFAEAAYAQLLKIAKLGKEET